MRLRDYVKKYYQDDYNCAETLLLATNEKYQLNIPKEAIPLIGGFGGGMCIEEPCGALTGGVAALGKMMIKTKAHDTDQLKVTVKAYVTRFNQVLGTHQCAPLKEKYKRADKGCLETVLLGADVFEEIVENYIYIEQV